MVLTKVYHTTTLTNGLQIMLNFPMTIKSVVPNKLYPFLFMNAFNLSFRVIYLIIFHYYIE